jgi:hypothetical protein
MSDGAPGANMRQEVYRVAFDEASAELSEILTRFDQLRLRKDRIEKVVEALKPLMPANESHVEEPEHSATLVERQAAAGEQPTAIAAPTPFAATPSPIPYTVQQAVEESNDPFSRRAENSSGLSSAAKDLREYSRLFNTGTSR